MATNSEIAQVRAYHRAGQAVARFHFEVDPGDLCTLRIGEDGTVVLEREEIIVSRESAETQATVVLCGPSAVSYLEGEPWSIDSTEQTARDMSLALAVLRSQIDDKDAAIDELSQVLRRARRFVRNPIVWDQIEAVASELLHFEGGALAEDDFRRIIVSVAEAAE